MKPIDMVKNYGGKVMDKIADKKPEIYFAAEMVLIGVGVVSACRNTLKLEKIVDGHNEKVQNLKDEYISVINETDVMKDKQYNKEVAKVYLRTGVQIARQYAPTAAIFALSATFRGMEYKYVKEIKKENLELSMLVHAGEATIARYRSKLIDLIGEEEERRFYAGTETKDIDYISVDENGKEKKQKIKGAETLNGELGRHAFIFDESCGAYVGHDISHNLYIASLLQNQATDNMYANGHIMLNEIYDSFGVDRSATGWREGCLSPDVGGKYEQVDLGIREVYILDEETEKYVKKILIDPRLDGRIDHLI